MRVLVAPDKFAGTLTAVEAAGAIADGWSRHAPHDRLVCRPMSDGGPGFCDVVRAALGGDMVTVTVRGPYGDPVPATVLLADGSAYVETAQACGLHLAPPERRRPEVAGTYGVAELVLAAVDGGARRVVIGLGGSGSNDGGAGFLAGLGARAEPPEALTSGGIGLERLRAVDLAPARERLAGVELVAASDVDNPLLGLRGATNVYGPQKGVSDERKPVLDAALGRLAAVTDPRLADAAGAGAAGGLGFALLLMGARRESGIGLVTRLSGLAECARAVDLVVTAEGSFDVSSRSGKAVSGVARVAQDALRPCVVLAGRVALSPREMRTLGVESAYSMVDLVGQADALSRPVESLAALAERVARTWSR